MKDCLANNIPHITQFKKKSFIGENRLKEQAAGGPSSSMYTTQHQWATSF